MTSFSKLKKFSIFCVGTITISSLFYLNFENFNVFRSFGKCDKQNLYISKWDHNWDRRDPNSMSKIGKDNIDFKKAIKATAKSMRHVILVRHGQYNIQGKNDTEKRLTQLGKLQAEVTGMRLVEIGAPYTSIVRSTMTRAKETSELIQSYLPAVPVIDDCLLVEGFPIPPDPPSRHSKPEKIFFQDGPRIEAAFRKYIYRCDYADKKDSYTIIVCHANVIRYFVCRALQFPPDAWLRLSLNHGSITWITVLPSGRVILRCFGETGHMMPQWITST